MYGDIHQLMRNALDEAEKAFLQGEVPVGAIIADTEGRVIAVAHNQPIGQKDPTAHAEILAMRKAGLFFNNYRLTGTILIATIEPCLMCMGAAINARIDGLVFGAFDPKGGAAGSLYRLQSDKRLNHRISVTSGIMEEECRALIQRFFRLHRNKT